MGYKYRREKTVAEGSAYKALNVYIPISIYQRLKDLSDEKSIPMSRLVTYAMDNELSQAVPFNYPCTMPETVYVEHAYTQEAGKIFRFLSKFGPQSIDQLMIARRDVGVIDKQRLMLGIREIINTDLVELITPIWSTFKFGKDYKVLVVKKSKEDRKAARIAKLKEELKQLGEENDGSEKIAGPLGKAAPDSEET